MNPYRLITTALCTILTGCGQAELVKVPVTGSATIRGKPAARLSVFLRPLDSETHGRLAGSTSARIRSDGTFTLGSQSPDDGIPPGRYKVLFMADDDQDCPPGVTKEQFNAKYCKFEAAQEVEIPPEGCTLPPFRLD